MTVRDRVRALVFRFARRALALRRPSARGNAVRGGTVSSLALRAAVEADVPALARLHVHTWNDTYAPIMKGPPVAIREAQWRAAFAKDDGSWFCIVAQRPDGELVAFVKGVFAERPEDPARLDKLYIDRAYQRLGLGRRLAGDAVRRFRARGSTRISAYVDPRNPSCGFFERLGGQWLIEGGRTNFSWYVWDDLEALEAACFPRGDG